MARNTVSVKDNDKGFKDLMNFLGQRRTVAVLVGIRGQAGSLVAYAAANEFGVHPRIPERSFLRSTLISRQSAYIKQIARAVRKLLDGFTPDIAFGRLGMLAVSDVQRTIRNRVPPPNAPMTIARKGSDTPLIDTGRMRQSIDYVVEVS